MNEKLKITNFIKKFCKLKMWIRILYLSVGIAYLASLIFFTKSILSLIGIETFIRIILLIVLYLYLLAYFLLGIIFLFTGKKGGFFFITAIAILATPILGISSFYIDKTYGIIDSIQKKYVEYKSYMVALSDKEEFRKVGIISAKDDPTGYIIPKEMIKKFNIDCELIEYDDYISMMSDLYDGEIDAMFVADNYVLMFNSYEKFANIANETKIVHGLSKELENVDKISYSTKDLTEPFTILLMGVDSTGDGISNASFNGDTLMMISFNPKTLAATVFSIPRDTYVPISCRGNQEDKINSSAYGGTSCVINTVQNLTGIDIDYYIKINFTGVVKLVDDLGGIEVDVPIDFCEQDSQRRFDEYLICLDKGYQKLNGEQALALSRHRHSLPLGDFQRVQHQQLVVEAMVKSLKNIKDLDSFYNILNDIAANVDTNITTPQILSLYKVGKNVLLNRVGDDAKLSIQKTYLTGYDLTMYMPRSRSYAYTFQYYRSSLEEIVDVMKETLELKRPELVKTFSFDANENYEPYVAGKKYYNESHRELLPSFIGQNRIDVEKWQGDRDLTVNYEEIKEGNELYDSSLPDGTVVAQSEVRGTLIDSLNEITISIISRSNDNNDTPEPSREDDNPGNSGEDENDEPKEETVPDFTNISLNEFNKWKNSLKNVNIIFETQVLTINDIMELNLTELNDNTIYKQSHPEGTKISEIATFTVYYYKLPTNTNED